MEYKEKVLEALKGGKTSEVIEYCLKGAINNGNPVYIEIAERLAAKYKLLIAEERRLLITKETYFQRQSELYDEIFGFINFLD
ncbi:MAG: hypothetical protein AAF502_07890 [Bacteroidota bacterium]